MPYQDKLLFKREGLIKTLPDKQKLRFIASRPAIKKVLKEVSLAETKGRLTVK